MPVGTRCRPELETTQAYSDPYDRVHCARMHGRQRPFDKIFNIGLNRAGTGSLTEALNILGYRAVHFKHDGRRVYDIVQDNAHSGRRLLSGLDARFDAFSDFTAYGFFDVLDTQYPNSKFSITWRELEAWLDSRARKVKKNRSDPNYRYDFLTVDRDRWTRDRALFRARTDDYFQARHNDLLVIDIPAGDGWQALCKFLDVPAPDAPFPWRNQLSSVTANG